MADKNSLLQYVAQKVGLEQLESMVDQAEQQLMQDPDINAQSIDDIIKSLEHVAENPEDYQRVLADAIRSGVVNEGDMPAQFNPIIVGVMLLAFLALRERFAAREATQQQGMGALSNMQQPMGGMEQQMQGGEMGQQMPLEMQQPQAFARGGLASLGRGGDTMLAHINPREAEVLRRMGGSGNINPLTGLPEFKGGILKSVGKIFSAVAPVVASALGGPLAGVLVGGALGGMNGGLKGALVGGLGGALAGGGASGIASSLGKSALGYLPSSIGSSLASSIGAQAIGAGLIGGATSALTGGNVLKGALTAGLTSYAAPKLASNFGDYLSPGYANAMSTGAQSAAMTGGNPFLGAAGGALGQFASGAAGLNGNAAPIEDHSTFSADSAGTGGEGALGASNLSAPNTPVIPGAKESTDLMGSAGKALMLGTLLAGKTPQAAAGGIAGSNLTPEQKEALNRGLTSYTASWNSPILPQQGTPEYDQMMSKINQGIGLTFSQPTLTAANSTNNAVMPAPQNFAHGGQVSSHYAAGGRADNISAKLSQGEYIFDAETVALLGDGSSKAGAAKLDELRQQIRKQKGKSLAKGKISPNAKGALSYMKGGM